MMETHKALNFSRDFVIGQLSGQYRLDLSSERVVEFYLPGTFEPTKSIYPVGHFDPSNGLLVLGSTEEAVSNVKKSLGLRIETDVQLTPEGLHG